MYITNQVNSAYAEYLKTNSTEQKSLVDYLNSDDDDSSSSLFDSLELSEEAYAAIEESNPGMLAALGYQTSDEVTDTLTSSSGSLLDKVELSEEAYSVLKDTNPELLEQLGYELPAEETE